MPEVGVFAADAGEIGPGALRAPQHRMVVLGLHRERVGAVALDLVAQRADHLAVAGVAALADVDVAPGQLQRRVEAHVRRLLDRLVDGEERRDLDDAADAGGGDDRDHEADGGAFELAMEQFGHDLTPPGSPRRRGQARCPARPPACRRTAGTARTVIQML